MARPAKIWLREQTGWWMTTLKGKQIRLAKDKAEAEKAFHLLLAHDQEPEVRGRPTFRLLADKFLEFSRETNASSTFDTHKRYLQSFCDHVKNRRAPDLRGEHVTTWLRAHPTWGPSTRSLAVQAIKACLAYAVREGNLGTHPLLKVPHGTIGVRVRILAPEERVAIRARASGTFKDFLFALEQTGARPYSEIGRLEAGFINWEEESAELPHHKNSRHGKRRILYFTPEMMGLLRRLAEKHPAGLLFRNRYGNPWDKSAWCKWKHIFANDLGIKGVTGYVLRHSYATDAMMRGVPLPTLAELMGTSVKMLLKHYGHVAQQKDALRAAAAKAVAT